MMVSTRGRYALRVMIDLAEHNNGKFIPLKDIAERQEISEKYLESIVKSLTKADVLEGLRGKGGGYRLTLQGNVSEEECVRRFRSGRGWKRLFGNICRVSPFRS